MPNVPKVPGVPALASYLSSPITLLVADLVQSALGFGRPEWGIFSGGESVIDADTVAAFEFRQDYPIADYPLEEGAFQSYDKVELPGDIRVRVCAGGALERRQAFLDSIFANINTTDLYDVVTPEAVYVGYCFTHMDFRRSADRGLGLIAVDLWMAEIRETSFANFSSTGQAGSVAQQDSAGGRVGNITVRPFGQSTQSPSAAAAVNTGNVQPLSPASRINSAFEAGGWM